MACFYPKQALRLNALTKAGKSVIRFISDDSAKAYSLANPSGSQLLSGLPCGQCTGCRLERSRQWAIRCMNEADLHAANSFITLTFDDDNLKVRDNPMSLDKSEFQRFMKRFRKRVFNVRYYMCGEYGELFKRPHYHAIIFGYDFPDKVLHKVKDNMRYYTSSLLSELWPYGFNVVTDVTFDTCAYVARYIMKKHLGKDAWKNYIDYIDQDTGEIVGHRIPEYTTMSRRSGIGKAWLETYLQDVYPRDKIFMRGRGFSRPPKYYDSLFEIINPEEHSRIKQDRILQASLNPKSVQQLIAEQVIKETQIKVLTRNLE